MLASVVLSTARWAAVYAIVLACTVCRGRWHRHKHLLHADVGNVKTQYEYCTTTMLGMTATLTFAELEAVYPTFNLVNAVITTGLMTALIHAHAAVVPLSALVDPSIACHGQSHSDQLHHSPSSFTEETAGATIPLVGYLVVDVVLLFGLAPQHRDYSGMAWFHLTVLLAALTVVGLQVGCPVFAWCSLSEACAVLVWVEEQMEHAAFPRLWPGLYISWAGVTVAAFVALRVIVFLIASLGGIAVLLDDGSNCMAPLVGRVALCGILTAALLQNLVVTYDSLLHWITLLRKRKRNGTS